MRKFAVTLLIYILLQLKLKCIFSSEMEFVDINTKNVFVEFNPLVSILDEIDPGRYGVDELLPLISKVAERFTKFYIGIDYYRGNTRDSWKSQLLSPIAMAKYNCLNTTNQKIEVILNIFRYGCKCAEIVQLANFAKRFADDVNKKCIRTVTTILLKSKERSDTCNPNHCSPVEQIFTGYQWGSQVKLTEYCNFKTFPYQLQNGSALVAFEYSNIADYFVLGNLTNCRAYVQNPISLSINWKMISFSDKNENELANMAYLVKSWENVLRHSNSVHILSRAFDSYDPDKRKWVTGWWYLLEDPGNTNTSNYIFEERVKVARKEDHDRDPTNFHWLSRVGNFSKNSTGIIYTMNVPLDILTVDFCLLLVLDDKILPGLENSLYKSNNTSVSACGSNKQVFFLLSNFPNEYITGLSLSTQIPSVLLVDRSFLYTLKYNNTFVQAVKSSVYNYGYFLNLEECASIRKNSAKTNQNLFLTIRDPDSKFYIFRFQVISYLRNYEATHLFRNTITLFEQCRNLIARIRKKSTKIGFALVNFQKPDNFYDSTWEMQNFIRYIDLLSKWTDQQSDITFFVGPDVSSADVGWYVNDVHNSKFVTTKELAINLSEFRYKKHNSTINYSVGTYDITILISVPLGAFAILFLIALYFMRYRYKSAKITQDELYKFLKGDANYDGLVKNAYIVPYDQNKYEIAEEKFQIEVGKELGAGEFGKVTQAKVSTPNGVIVVAAKTTNPQKFHTTMLNGLLSEVKLLAYIGKHANIIELIGANTTYIKEGQVFVFLELCHMGSLETFLREMRLLENNRPEYMTAMQSLDIDMSAISNTRKVDKALSEDMYRWSTEICNGMTYLSSKHVVHADLASRNVLLNIRRQVKICDFGLSRRMYNYTTYVKTKQEPLPWKWMAPEALQYMHFNEKSDVWAYGITLWEIYSLGSTPYAGLTWSVDFVAMLKSGLLPPAPEFDGDNMYQVMKDCWAILPEQRPSFSRLLQLLTSRALED